ncbi:hypothetical protein GWO60_08935 [Corynebacterium macginleyi]|uniref:ATP-dependent helicase Rep n=1 Tax=Corynebacterium macginleyi TaxID=38290 RepID=A0ABS1Y7V2_9CORY|nr:hypothetical protein [Corynebacterium macginleyi]MBK4174630.1 hypothetical protein [Corynebacterium macginleyi]MBM0244460.1 hypothetical protein [Corynebacterium macginleyi]
MNYEEVIALLGVDVVRKLQGAEHDQPEKTAEDSAPTMDAKVTVPAGVRKMGRSRSWMLTIPAKVDDPEIPVEVREGAKPMKEEARYFSREDLVRNLQGKYSVGRFQLEKGSENGYLHWQGYIYHDAAVHGSAVWKRIPGAHLDKTRNVDAAREYARKTKTAVVGVEPVEWGDDSKLAQRAKHFARRRGVDLLHEAIWEKELSEREIIERYPEALKALSGIRTEIRIRDAEEAQKLRDVEVIWLWGESRAGKSSFAYEAWPRNEVYWVGSYRNPWDDYASQPVIVLDDFSGRIDWEDFLHLADRYPMRLPARYSDTWALHKTLVVISNDPPWLFYRGQSLETRLSLVRRITSCLQFSRSTGPQAWGQKDLETMLVKSHAS